MWLKIALGALIVAFCTLLGYLSAGKARARAHFYSAFCDFNERYLAELRYTRKPLGAFLKEQPEKGDFAAVVKSYANQREKKQALSYLKEEERADLDGYLAALGRGDARTQSAFFGERSGALARKKEECAKEAKTRSELSVKLGLLAGLAFVILVI